MRVKIKCCASVRICDDDKGAQLCADNKRADEYLMLGLSRAERANPSGFRLPDDDEPVKVVHSLGSLTGPDLDLVLILNSETRKLFNESADLLLSELPAQIPTLIILIPRPLISAPEYREEPVYSFICSASVFKALLAIRVKLPPETLCFALLHAILNGQLKIDRVLVRQLPYPSRIALSDGEPSRAALIMPHRGKPEYLERALYFLSRVAGEGLRIRVGLDAEEPGEYEHLREQYPDVEFFFARPSPVGPYVIRQELANRSAEPIMLFHDSDDISCYDRLTTLYAEMRRTGCGLVGSHDLLVNEASGMVLAARYPSDVSAAVRQGNDGALLLGTSMVRRADFFRAGGFSTDQFVANDTQFLLRAYFTLKIRNVDNFLYIRRVHSASLTSATETALGVPLRRGLSKRWNEDFRAIERGQMSLEQSSLRQIRRDVNYQFLPFEPRRAEELNDRGTRKDMTR